MPEPIADISTLIPELPTIRIDGETYPLAHPLDFGIAGIQELERMRLRITVLAATPEEQLGDDEKRELNEMLDRIVRLIAPTVGEDVHERLRDAHRLAILMAFTDALPSTGGSTAAQENGTSRPKAKAKSKTGARSSRGSSGSTARGTRKRG